MRLLQQVVRQALRHDPPLLQHIGAIGDAERLEHVLLDQQNGGAVVAHLGDDVEHVVDDGRRQPERRLVEQHDAWPRHQRPSDRHHLLLAARQLAGRLATLVAQDRKQVVDPLQRLRSRRARRGQIAAEFEVLLDRHLGKEPPPLRHQRDAVAAIGVRLDLGHVGAIEAQCALAAAQQARDGVDQRRLARAVGPDHRDDLAAVDVERGVPHRRRVAVADMEVAGFKQHRLCPDRC